MGSNTPSTNSITTSQTLLLAPPSIAHHEETLRKVYTTFNRATSDLQMLDRLAQGLVILPPSRYDLVVVLSEDDEDDDEKAGSQVQHTGGSGIRGSDSTANSSSRKRWLTRAVYDVVVASMKVGGILRAQGDDAVQALPEADALLAGLVPSKSVTGGYEKLEEVDESGAVPLRFGAKKKTQQTTTNGSGLGNAQSGKSAGVAIATTNGHTNGYTNGANGAAASNGGVVKLASLDDLDDYEDGDDLIDENTLLGEEDMNRPIRPPPECAPTVNKTRRACKDCTCGLASRLLAEESTRRTQANTALKGLQSQLADDDLELDFTPQGKVGSCGSCSLGDAFRCDGCPYKGLPAFKPGEEVRIVNDFVQL